MLSSNNKTNSVTGEKIIGSEFDTFADSYEDALNEGLKYSGESKDFFASERVKHTVDVINKHGLLSQRILDFGCGTGSSIPLLLAVNGAEVVVGSEVSQNSLKVARSSISDKRASFVQNEMLQEMEPFDLIFCNGVFHHIPPAERRAALELLHTLLKPGGFFALWENNPWNPGTRYIMSKIPFDQDAVTLSPPETKNLLCGVGFKLVEQNFLFYFPKFLSFLRCTEAALRKVPLGAQYVTFSKKA